MTAAVFALESLLNVATLSVRSVAHAGPVAPGEVIEEPIVACAAAPAASAGGTRGDGTGSDWDPTPDAILDGMSNVTLGFKCSSFGRVQYTSRN